RPHPLTPRSKITHALSLPHISIRRRPNPSPTQSAAVLFSSRTGDLQPHRRQPLPSPPRSTRATHVVAILSLLSLHRTPLLSLPHAANPSASRSRSLPSPRHHPPPLAAGLDPLPPLPSEHCRLPDPLHPPPWPLSPVLHAAATHGTAQQGARIAPTRSDWRLPGLGSGLHDPGATTATTGRRGFMHAPVAGSDHPWRHVLKVRERPRLHSKAIRAGVDWRARTRWMDGGDTDLLRRVSQEAVHPAATTSTARRWWPACNATAASPVTSSLIILVSSWRSCCA
uniref:Uncharacterized protein n=1 Tax=Aegilops tauschii subsp. strangulata TaxID=200361 RepID=A0A453EY85_AEGTS